MTDVEREESETGKFSKWVHVKNWISDYLKASDIDIDGSKNVGVNVKTITEEDPDAATKNNGAFSLIYNGDGQLWRIDYTIAGQTFRKTLNYASGKLTVIGQWVKQ